jgi:hypothetical protein
MIMPSQGLTLPYMTLHEFIQRECCLFEYLKHIAALDELFS